MSEVYAYVGFIFVWGCVVAIVGTLVGLAVWVIIHARHCVKEHDKLLAVRQRVYTCHRWMAGFKDLDIIWDYLLANDGTPGQIDDVRDKYAHARGTNVYGKPHERTETKEKIF